MSFLNNYFKISYFKISFHVRTEWYCIEKSADNENYDIIWEDFMKQNERDFHNDNLLIKF